MAVKIYGEQRYHVPLEVPNTPYYQRMPRSKEGFLMESAYRAAVNGLGPSGIAVCMVPVIHRDLGPLGLKVPKSAQRWRDNGDDQSNEDWIKEVMERQAEGHSLGVAPPTHGLAQLIAYFNDQYRLEITGYLTAIAEKWAGHPSYIAGGVVDYTWERTYRETDRGQYVVDTNGCREWETHMTWLHTYRRVSLSDRVCRSRIWQGSREFNQLYDTIADAFGDRAVRDLHHRNCGVWQGNLVCIDWGWE
ncbi:MAG: hypothetical protein ACW99G_23305 [Candidatus Thorarchaeota archaeon]|jgi:hypothetical protein